MRLRLVRLAALIGLLASLVGGGVPWPH